MVVIILPSKRMTTPLSQFRDLTCLLFRVVDPQARFEDVDRLVHKLHDVVSDGATTPRPAFLEPLFMHECLRPPTPPTLVIHPDQKAEPIPPADIVVKPEAEPGSVRNVIVNLPPTTVHAVKLGSKESTKDNAILKDLKRDTEDTEDEESVATPDDDEEDEEDEEEDDVPSTVSSEDDDDAEDDAEDDDAEDDDAEGDDDDAEDDDAEDDDAEESETEEEDITLLKIKKDKYYWSPTSKRVYEYLETGYGDCIGTYVDGKIVPK